MWIHRSISDELSNIVKSFPILALVGPRQVGKTSLLERVFPEYHYVSLDTASIAEMMETRPADFLAQYPPPVILDEVQYAPGFFSTIKNTVDKHRNQNGQFILTGSQNFTLMENVAESLAGRVAVIPFLGLSGAEWAEHGFAEHNEWIDFLWRGGFPALWAGGDNAPSRDRWYQGYVATYLERDVRQLLNVGSLRDFERFLRSCAARCGQSLNMSEISRDVGISVPTVKQWLSVLQTSNQIFLLEPYYRSLGKRLFKSPKLYFTDTGLAAFLMGFHSPRALWSSPSLGALWENYVIIQWLRWRDWRSPSVSLWYWRDQQGNEVDLILEIDQRMVAIECKLTERPSLRDIKGIQKLSAFYGEEMIAHAYVACSTQYTFDLNRQVTAQSGWKTWEI
jgi:predicted AAA+ superfamily ATPase